MDIYQIIKSDHALANGLIERAAAARSPEWRYQLCRELLQVIHVHAKALMTALPAVLASRDPIAGRAADLAAPRPARQISSIAETLLTEALTLDPESPAFRRLFDKARAECSHEMQIEAEIILAVAGCILDRSQAEQLGQRMRMLKDDYIQASHMGSTSLRADAGYYS